jgi:hypothetical protein
MQRKALHLIGLLALAIVLRADSCLIEQRTISTVVGGDIPTMWTTTGFAENQQTLFVEAADQVDDALEEFSEDADLDSIHVTGVCWEILANRGSTARQAASRTGSVTVNGIALLTFDIPNTMEGTEGCSGDGSVTFNAAGLDHINDRLNAYLAGWNSGSADPDLLDFTFVSQWDSDPAPTSGRPEPLTDFRGGSALRSPPG